MNSPGSQRAACAVCSVEYPGPIRPVAGDRPPAGVGTGDSLRLSAAPAQETKLARRPSFCGGPGVGMAAAELRDLPGRRPSGVYPDAPCRHPSLGADRRKMAPASVFRLLGADWENMERNYPAFTKNFQKNHNFHQISLCIRTKMEYNYKESIRKSERRCRPCQTEESKWCCTPANWR